MKSYLGFIKKEFLHIFRDKRTMLILFGIPIAQILIFGYVIKNEIRDIPIGIFDQSNDQMTREITTKIISSGYFILKRNLQSSGEIEGLMKQGDVKEVIVFESGFSKKMKNEGSATIEIITDASEPNTANLLVNYTRGILIDYMQKNTSQTNTQFVIEPKVRMVYNEGMKDVFMFVPGTMAMILILISAMMTSISIAREKELGTLEVLMVSPMKPSQIIIGKVIPYILLSSIIAVIIILMGYFVFELPVRGSLILLLAESFLYIIMALSMGILISTVSKSQQVAMFISLFALLLPTILLSGFIYPIENMPWILQFIANLMPPKWFIIIIKSIMIKGEGLDLIWKETLILVGMTLLFLLIAIKKFKTRLE